MIQIKPYTILPSHEKIEKIYLTLIARTLPFKEADLTDGKNPFPDGLFDGKKSKMKNMPSADNARKIIKDYSETLYLFLFDNNDKLKRDSLYKLLFSFMDDESIEQNGLTGVKEAEDKSKGTAISDVFSYDRFSSSSMIHQFIQALNVPVCPYCNRNFTTTLVKGKNNQKKTRPELDHFLSKNEHPYFAISILNLVPSCGICNRLKGKNNDSILYPYTEGVGDYYHFRTQPKGDLSYLIGARVDFDLELVVNKDKKCNFVKRVDNSKNIFGWENIYKEAHKDLICDLFFQRYIFTDNMLHDLYEKFKGEGLFDSPDELKNLLYLRNIGENNWGERPLSKLIHDIDQEIESLYQTDDSNFFREKINVKE